MIKCCHHVPVQFSAIQRPSMCLAEVSLSFPFVENGTNGTCTTWNISANVSGNNLTDKDKVCGISCGLVWFGVSLLVVLWSAQATKTFCGVLSVVVVFTSAQCRTEQPGHVAHSALRFGHQSALASIDLDLLTSFARNFPLFHQQRAPEIAFSKICRFCSTELTLRLVTMII